MKKLIFLIPFLLSFVTTWSQASLLFNARMNITGVTGSDPYTLTGVIQAETGQWSAADINVSLDSIYHQEGDDLLNYKINSITSAVGNNFVIVVDDVMNSGILPSTGTEWCITEFTTNYKFPVIPKNLSSAFEAMIENRFKQRLDAAITTGGGTSLLDTISQTSHGFSVNQLINIQSVTGNGQLADADVDSLFAMGIVQEVINANTFVVQYSGLKTISGVVAGLQYYTSATAGEATETAPSKIQVAYQGVAANTARLVFDRFSETTGESASEATSEPADLITRNYADPWLKIPNFSQNFLEKDDDCNIVLTGTSITQGGGYTPNRTNASTLPIFCDGYDLAGRLWEELSPRWPGQQYRRYNASGYFTKVGTWATKQTDPTWDDEAKEPLCDASTSASASLTFVIPDSAWTARFIYKSEKDGDVCTVTVAEGNNKLQVQIDSNLTWVEANGFVFTTEEPHDTTPVYSPDTLLYGDYSNGYGNTIFGKRLRFRARNDDGSFNQLTGDKTVTITKSSNTSKRLSYWGVEWSRAKYMLSIINGARAGKAYDTDLVPFGTAYYAMTDIIYFKPDLILCEISHNNYGSIPSVTIPKVQEFYLNEAAGGGSAFQKLSLDSLTNGFDTTDIVFFNPSIGISNFTSDGEMTGTYYQGRFWSVADNRDYVASWFRVNHPEYLFADCHSALREAAVKYYGTYKTGVVASSNDGVTLFRDLNHPNKRGYGVMFKAIENIFKF